MNSIFQHTDRAIRRGNLDYNGRQKQAKEVYFCKLEQGIFFDEECEDVKEGQDEDLVRCLTVMGSPKEEQLLETV